VVPVASCLCGGGDLGPYSGPRQPGILVAVTIFFAGLAVWAVSGLVIAGFLARQGHHFWLLALMGLGFGPFLIVIWAEALHRLPSRVTMVQPDPTHVDITASGPNKPDLTNEHGGWIDVLVGLDGDDESLASVDSVLTTLGPAIGRLRLTSVIDHEIANANDAFERDDDRVAFLRTAAHKLGYEDAEISMVSGRPDKALLEHATTNDFDLVVVAHRRNELRGALRGSTVARLARSADLAVLIGPAT